MVHLDPIGHAYADSGAALFTYSEHRDGMLWYTVMADSFGLRLSAQTTGLYAEACVRQGDWADFASFMPGGTHHFGTHTHPVVKTPFPYGWRDLPSGSWGDPDSVATVMADNIPWVNEIYTRNGFTALDNWMFHGTSASFVGMDTALWCPPTPVPVPYPNCFKMGGGERGQLWIYRGTWSLEPGDSIDTAYQTASDYIKMAEVGGIIGFDQVHGPEGMVYGTLPYQKRDFLRAYMEWREMARRGERSAIRHFTWMIHPYQLSASDAGTDGILIRTTIRNLVQWLNQHWIGQTDDTGNVMAVYANAAQIRTRFENWESLHSTEAAALQADLEAGVRPLYLPSIYDRLETCFYVDKLPYADSLAVVHEFEDRDTGAQLFSIWSASGNRMLHSSFSGTYRVYHGTGPSIILPAAAIVVEPVPILIEAVSSTAAEDGGGDLFVPILEQNHPNPFNPVTRIRFEIPESGPVKLEIFDTQGRRVAGLMDEWKRAGTYSVEWKGVDEDGRRVGSGIYFYRLAAGGSRVSKKMVLLE